MAPLPRPFANIPLNKPPKKKKADPATPPPPVVVEAPPVKLRRGPPTLEHLLSPEDLEKIAETLTSGAFRETAARRVGVSLETFEKWMARGKKEKRGPYHDFAVMVSKAEAEAEMYHIERLHSGAPKWESSAWWLEHHFPGRWGKKDQRFKSPQGEGKDSDADDKQPAGDVEDPIEKLSRLLTAQTARADKIGDLAGTGTGSSQAALGDVAVLGASGTASAGDATSGKPA